MAELMTLDISTICGRSFGLCVASSVCGLEVKHMLAKMDSTFQVPKMRLLHKNAEIPDGLPIGESISDAQALLTLLLSRPKDCAEFIEHPGPLMDASSEVVKDKDCVLHRIKVDPMDLEYAPAFQNDKELVLVAVKINGTALKYVSESLRDDIDVVFAAIESRRYCLHLASARLQAIPEIALLQKVHNPIKVGKRIKFECSRSYCFLQSMQSLLCIHDFYGGTANPRTCSLCFVFWMFYLILAVVALTARGVVSGVLLITTLIVIGCHVGAFVTLALLQRRCLGRRFRSKLVERAKWQAERV